MAHDIYQQAFEKAKSDLAIAVERKAKAESEAVKAQNDAIQLRRTVTALAILVGEDVEDSMGLTQAVRLLFQTRQNWMPLSDVKGQVEALGVSLADLKNPDASVMSVLNRLVSAGELQTAMRRYKTSTGITDLKAWKPADQSKDKVPEVTDDDIPF